MSGEKEQYPATPAPQPKRAENATLPLPDQQPDTHLPNGQANGVASHDHDDSVVQVGSDMAITKGRTPKKIALPFADTPIIRRNKEMRKRGSGEGHRRSSTGMRGRRASSLIDSGTSNGGQIPSTRSIMTFCGVYIDNVTNCAVRKTAAAPTTPFLTINLINGLEADDFLFLETAVPHADVETLDFFKHIEQSIPEPRRMKQLLTWCGTRALPEKQSGDGVNGGAVLAGKSALK